MAINPLPGALCEFGVYQGEGLEYIAYYSKKYLGIGVPLGVYGFDSFEGMPPTCIAIRDDHAEVWRQGGFSDTNMESVQARVPSARLIKGVFSDLMPLSSYGIDKVRFARIDCDIYEGYRDALRLLTPCLQVGALLLFDEGISIPDPRYHESLAQSGEKAIREWKDSTGIKLKTLIEKPNWTEILTLVKEIP